MISLGQPLAEFIHVYHGFHSPGATCDIRMFNAVDGVPTVIATERHDNENTSITNLAEQIAAEIAQRFFMNEDGTMKPFRWIEHYPDGPRADWDSLDRERFSIVSFSFDRPRKSTCFGRPRVTLGSPSWTHIKPEEIARLLDTPQTMTLTSAEPLMNRVRRTMRWS